jgi:phosphoglycerate kinase
MPKQTIKDVRVEGKRVLVRVDYNVPFEPGTAIIADDSRIRATLPTLMYLLQRNATVILCTHVGRPEGKVVEKLRVKPIADRLSYLLGMEVGYVNDCVGPTVQKRVLELKPSEILLLENLRFYPDEEINDALFTQELASLADIYVNDAFATSHRAHASTEGVAHHLQAVAGLLMENELEMLGKAFDSPKRPVVAILGGAKLSEKMGVLDYFVDRVDAILVGGGMAATFLSALGHIVGDSKVEVDRLRFVQEIMERAKRQGVTLTIPTDVVIGQTFEANTEPKNVQVSEIPQGWKIMDIGHATVKAFIDELTIAKTILWNGPMGVFEFPPFASGTISVANTLANHKHATTVVGGGSTAEAVAELGLVESMTHVSTGGGASLQFFEGRDLPGVVVLEDR